MPRYLGQQQNVVRRVIVAAPPRPPVPQLAMPQAVPQPVYNVPTFQPPIVTVAQPVLPFNHPVPVQRPHFYHQTAPANQQFISGQSAASVTLNDLEYLQYSDPIMEDFQYNQSQVLSVDTNFSSEYQEQTFQQRQAFPAVQHVRYQQPNTPYITVVEQGETQPQPQQQQQTYSIEAPQRYQNISQVAAVPAIEAPQRRYQQVSVAPTPPHPAGSTSVSSSCN